MSEFLAFYKNGKYQFCIKADDVKSLSLQRNKIFKEERIIANETIKKENYFDSINNHSKNWSVKEYV